MRARARWSFAGLLLAASAAGATVGPSTSPAGGTALDAEGRKRAEIYAHLMRAQVSVHRRDYGAAAQEVRKAAELDPQSADLLVDGATLVLRGDPAEAERLARRAMEIAPQHAGALRFVAERAAARALGPRRDTESRVEAVTLLERLASAEGPTDPQVLAILIQLHLQAEEFAAATEVAQRLVRERPGDAEAVKTLAQLLLHANKEREALVALLDFLADHPEEQALFDWADQLANGIDGWDTVAATLTPRLAGRAASLEALRLLGEAHLHLGNATEAVAVLERAREARADDPRVRRDLAIAYRGVGRLADAVDLLEALLADPGDHPVVRELLGETRAQQADSAGALEQFELALSGLAGEAQGAAHRDSIRQRMALLSMSSHREDRVPKILDSLEQDGGPLVAEIRARLALHERDWTAARRFASALESLGQPGVAALIEGEAAAGEKHWSKAAEFFQRAVDKLGPAGVRSSAEIYRDVDHPEDGLRLLRQWTDREAKRADARYWLGVFLYEIDRFDEAEVELRQAIEMDPQHAPALNFLGYGLAERAIRLDDALKLIQRAVAIDPWNGAYLDSLGWVYYQMGRFDEARGPLERAAREMPKDSTVLDHLGDIYLRLGQRDLALGAWGRALDAAPEDPSALRRKIARESEIRDEALGHRPSGSPPSR